MLKYLLKYINLHIIQIILGFVQIIFSSLNIQILVFPEHFYHKRLSLSQSFTYPNCFLHSLLSQCVFKMKIFVETE